MSRAIPALETTEQESTTEPVAQFESREDCMRREWAENSADVAWQILKFLQGRRRTEVSLVELESTETYKRSDEAEKKALRFVAAQAEPGESSEDDNLRLTQQDNFLLLYVDGKTLGHGDRVAEIQGIPAAVKHAQEVDEALFPAKQYASPELFRWVWGAR